MGLNICNNCRRENDLIEKQNIAKNNSSYIFDSSKHLISREPKQNSSKSIKKSLIKINIIK